MLELRTAGNALRNAQTFVRTPCRYASSRVPSRCVWYLCRVVGVAACLASDCRFQASRACPTLYAARSIYVADTHVADPDGRRSRKRTLTLHHAGGASRCHEPTASSKSSSNRYPQPYPSTGDSLARRLGTSLSNLNGIIICRPVCGCNSRQLWSFYISTVLFNR